MPDTLKKRRMTFAVIVPTLNSPLVDQTVVSLLNQECPLVDYSIIVVGCDDHNLVPSSDRLQFIRSPEPLSPAAARNLGVKMSASDYLAFTDADCIADSRWLANLAFALSRDPMLIAGGGIKFDKRNFWTYVDNLSTFHDVLAHLPAGGRDQLPSLNLAMRRDVFEEIGGFDERYPHAAGEDSDLTFRFKRAGYQLQFVPSAVVHHQPSRESFRQLIQHGTLRGRYSLLVDPRYVGEVGLAHVLRSPLILFLLSPFLAAYAALKPFLIHPGMTHHLPAFPFVYLSKIAWCFGAGERLCGPDPIRDIQPRLLESSSNQSESNWR